MCARMPELQISKADWLKLQECHWIGRRYKQNEPTDQQQLKTKAKHCIEKSACLLFRKNKYNLNTEICRYEYRLIDNTPFFCGTPRFQENLRKQKSSIGCKRKSLFMNNISID